MRFTLKVVRYGMNHALQVFEDEEIIGTTIQEHKNVQVILDSFRICLLSIKPEYFKAITVSTNPVNLMVSYESVWEYRGYLDEM